jgi:hypothetical protein
LPVGFRRCRTGIGGSLKPWRSAKRPAAWPACSDFPRGGCASFDVNSGRAGGGSSAIWRMRGGRWLRGNDRLTPFGQKTQPKFNLDVPPQ